MTQTGTSTFDVTFDRRIDVGIDRRSPVSWSIFERFGPFPYTGVFRHVRYVPGDPAPDGPEAPSGLRTVPAATLAEAVRHCHGGALGRPLRAV